MDKGQRTTPIALGPQI